MFYLTKHSTHFIYGYMASDIWLRTIQIAREREREIFYLTMHSTHFIYGYMASDIWLRTIQIAREREMFYLTTHSTHFIYGYMASDIWLRTIRIVRMHHPTDRITHTTAFVTPVVEHWLERECWNELITIDLSIQQQKNVLLNICSIQNLTCIHGINTK